VIRTRGLLHAMQTRYQLRQSPIAERAAIYTTCPFRDGARFERALPSRGPWEIWTPDLSRARGTLYLAELKAQDPRQSRRRAGSNARRWHGGRGPGPQYDLTLAGSTQMSLRPRPLCFPLLSSQLAIGFPGHPLLGLPGADSRDGRIRTLDTQFWRLLFSR
jgi:hypothetical protein